ncbi:MBL fold metallo-hydrolase [Brevibacillus reuszeri]|uniref:MBL fold metallo-hydrolase n=1 Tax=Brevibacillus reuszeri TaxID=54915 RepID=UPI00289EC2B6|nr:MBL fold metallo-hydrolase [Brevibacillus reuszeri]
MLHIHQHEAVTCVEGMVQKAGRDASIYVFITDGMMIDTGPQIIAGDLIPFLQEASFDSVVLTHSHEDHVGNAAWIEAHRQIPIYIHETGVDACAKQASYPKYRQLTWGIRAPFTALPIRATFQSRTLDWKVLYTPGHAHDHIALIHDATGRLFSGDLFLGIKTKVILHVESIPLQIESIRLVLSHNFGAMYCAHAGYIADGRAVLQQKLDYLENLSGEICHLHSMGLAENEIQARLFTGNQLIVEISEGEFDSLHIVRSVLAGRIRESKS